MTLSKKVELIGGLATLILGLIAPFCRHGVADTFRLYWLWPGLALGALVPIIIPGSFVAMGSYLDAVKSKTFGFVVLLVGGIFVTVMTLVYVFGGAIFYVFGLLGGIVILVQALLAIVTMILSVAVRTQAVRN
jgi:hypothetical protein